MARIGMMGGKVRGTPLVFTAANPSGSLVAMGPQGYPIDGATAYGVAAVDYPSLPDLLPEAIEPPQIDYEATAKLVA